MNDYDLLIRIDPLFYGVRAGDEGQSALLNANAIVNELRQIRPGFDPVALLYADLKVLSAFYSCGHIVDHWV